MYNPAPRSGYFHLAGDCLPKRALLSLSWYCPPPFLERNLEIKGWETNSNPYSKWIGKCGPTCLGVCVGVPMLCSKAAFPPMFLLEHLLTNPL